MVVATSFCYEKVRRMMHTAIVSYLLKSWYLELPVCKIIKTILKNSCYELHLRQQELLENPF